MRTHFKFNRDPSHSGINFNPMMSKWDKFVKKCFSKLCEGLKFIFAY